MSDKSGLVEFARRLEAKGVELLSTGGTRRTLEEAGIAVKDVAQYTGYPEMMDGRVKTLHPRIHGGLLCRRDNPTDMASANEHGILPIDLVVVNLYPFAQTIARGDVPVEEAIEQIDIGGPSMVRSASKNHAFVTIATSPSQYNEIASELEAHGGTTLALRRRLAGEAFDHTAKYDTTIAAYFAQLESGEPLNSDVGDAFPEQLSVLAHSQGNAPLRRKPPPSRFALHGRRCPCRGARQR